MTCTLMPKKTSRHFKRRTDRWYANHPECPRHDLKTKTISKKKKPLADRIAEFLTNILESKNTNWVRHTVKEEIKSGPNRHERRRLARLSARSKNRAK